MKKGKIIVPTNGDLFLANQGSFFWHGDYRYDSSDGLKIRSLDECFYHRYLSFFGFVHTYEPDIEGSEKRPDFGVANNFLIELCSVDYPEKNGHDSDRDAAYKDGMLQKRAEYLDLGFNAMEIYYKALVINGEDASKNQALNVIAKYNPNFRTRPAKDITFTCFKGNGNADRLRHRFYYSRKEAEKINKVIRHYKP